MWEVQETKRNFDEHCAVHKCKPQQCPERLALWLAISHAALQNEALVRYQVKAGLNGKAPQGG